MTEQSSFENIQDSPFIKNIPDEFKDRITYYHVKNNKTEMSHAFANVSDYNKKIIGGSGGVNFKNIIKFYTDQLKQYTNFGRHIYFCEFFFKELIMKDFLKNIKQGYITKEQYQTVINSSEFIKKIEENEKIYKGDQYALSMIRKIKEQIYDWKKVKKEIFFDWTNDSEKIHVSIEFYIALLSEYRSSIETNSLSKEILILEECIEYFMNPPSNTAVFTDTLKNFSGDRYLQKGEVLYLTIYNILFIDKTLNPLIIEDLKESFQIMLQNKLIESSMAHVHTIKNVKFLFESKYFAKFWLLGLCQTHISYAHELFFDTDFFEKYLDTMKYSIEPVKNISSTYIIENNSHEVVLLDEKMRAYKYFSDMGSVNKKTILYKASDLKNHTETGDFLNKTLKEICQDFLKSERVDNILLSPLAEMSKRFISSNLTYFTFRTSIIETDFHIWNELEKKHANTWIDVNIFTENIFRSDPKLYNLFHRIHSSYLNEIGRKMESKDIPYLFGEKELFKRFLIYLATLGIIDLAGNEEQKELGYYSGTGYGYSYGLYLTENIVTVFEPGYIRFKTRNTLDTFSISKENHISGQDIYLSYDTPENILKNFAEFSILEKLESHIILKMDRDTLIKAKNIYNRSAGDIRKAFESIHLSLPKNIEVLLDSVESKKEDLTLLPMGIPVIFENIGTFKEFMKLKMFNKYVLYENESINLIVFSPQFKNLENTLNARNIVYKSIILK